MSVRKDASSDDAIAEGGMEKALEIAYPKVVSPCNPVDVVREGDKEQEGVSNVGYTERTRKHTLTKKGYTYQLSVKTSNLKAKKGDLVQRIRRTLLEQGQSVDLRKFKRDLSEARVVFSEFQDIVNDIKVFAKPDEYMRDIDRIIEQVDREWLDF